MQEVRSSLVVDAPAERVFEHVDDWQNTDRYLRFVRLQPTDPLHTQGTGARFRARVSFVSPAPFRWEGQAEIADHYYPERMELRSTSGGFSLGWTFGRVGERTLVELRVTFAFPGGVVGHLAGSAFVPVTQRNLDGALHRLKQQVEKGGP